MSRALDMTFLDPWSAGEFVQKMQKKYADAENLETAYQGL